MKSKLLIIIFALFLPFSYAQEEKPDTALSLEQLLEGERIKEQIRRYESDMWNY